MKCSIDGCEKKAISKGLCSAHYHKQRRDGLKKKRRPLGRDYAPLGQGEKWNVAGLFGIERTDDLSDLDAIVDRIM